MPFSGDGPVPPHDILGNRTTFCSMVHGLRPARTHTRTHKTECKGEATTRNVTRKRSETKPQRVSTAKGHKTRTHLCIENVLAHDASLLCCVIFNQTVSRSLAHTFLGLLFRFSLGNEVCVCVLMDGAGVDNGWVLAEDSRTPWQKRYSPFAVVSFESAPAQP